jgi:hypothetical protein
MEECPVKPPKLISAKSTKVICARCGAWSYRYPDFMGGDEMWDCDKCGNTSCYKREARPYGKKSRHWEKIVDWFNDVYLNIPYWDWDTVVTEPPMKDLDWAAIEEWFRSRHIYRIFIPLPQIEFETRHNDDGTITNVVTVLQE